MSADAGADAHLEIAHVLFMDIVGYSKLLSSEQRARFGLLNEIVRCRSFRQVFPEEPKQTIQAAQVLTKKRPEIAAPANRIEAGAAK